MSCVEKARQHCNALRKLWIEAPEREREAISAEIAGLTQRGAFESLSDRVLDELQGSSDG
jgi:hypothetical protein